MSSKRRIKLIAPGMQGRIIFSFLAVGLFTVALQLIVVTGVLSRAAVELPELGNLLSSQLNDMLVWMGVVCVGVTLPLTFLVALNLTFRIAGPLFRFQRFLQQVQNGEAPEDIHIRDKDELHELCHLLNEVTRAQRLEQRSGLDEEPSEQAA